MCSINSDAQSPVERLDAIELEMRRLAAERAARLDEIEGSGVLAEDGFVSLRSWLVHRYQLSGGEVAGWLRERRAVGLDEVEAAFGAGEIGGSAVRELGRAASNPRCGDQLGEVIDILLEIARAERHVDLRAVVRQWERLADTDGAAPEPEVGHAGRRVRLRQDLDGVFHLDGRFASAQGAVIEELLDRFESAELCADLDAARADGHRGELPRTGAQRAADALVAALTQAVSTPPDARAPEPLVNVVVDRQTFEHHLTAQLSDEAPRPLEPATCRDRVSRTRHGSWLDPRELPALAVIGHVRRVVLDSAGVVVDLGRRQRLFTGSAREALALTATTCAFAGCGVPTHRAQVDHRDDWSRGGPTDQVNGVPLCGRHHRLKATGYRVWRDPAGTWHTTRPDGAEITPLRAPPVAA